MTGEGKDAYRERYLATMDGRISWFGEQADRARFLYGTSRAVLIVLGTIIPVIASAGDQLAFGHVQATVTILSMLSALIVALETQFKPGEKWQHFRSAEMALESIKREFEHRWSLASDDRARQQSVDLLFEQAEALMKAESGTFWQKLMPRAEKAN